MIEPADYIRAYMTERAPELAASALVIVDMQYVSGSRDGTLGRRMRAERSNLTDYRFDRIERLVVPNIRRMAPPVFRTVAARWSTSRKDQSAPIARTPPRTCVSSTPTPATSPAAASMRSCAS